MTDEDLIKWSERVRLLFRGEMDEILFTLARSQFASLPFAPAWSALDDYAVAHGGSRARFIAGKFLEFYAAQRDTDAVRVAALRRENEMHETEKERIFLSQHIARERAEQLALVARATPKELASALAIIDDLGWRSVSADPVDWSRARLLAVTDILRDAPILTYNITRSARAEPVSPADFWRSASQKGRI